MRALTHPVTLAAAGLILLNDFVLRGVAPGWLTGKLSDVGWLVVVLVVIAEALVLARIPTRAARVGAVGVAAGFYTTLQLWPPPGPVGRPAMKARQNPPGPSRHRVTHP